MFSTRTPVWCFLRILPALCPLANNSSSRYRTSTRSSEAQSAPNCGCWVLAHTTKASWAVVYNCRVAGPTKFISALVNVVSGKLLTERLVAWCCMRIMFFDGLFSSLNSDVTKSWSRALSPSATVTHAGACPRSGHRGKHKTGQTCQVVTASTATAHRHAGSPAVACAPRGTEARTACANLRQNSRGYRDAMFTQRRL